MAAGNGQGTLRELAPVLGGAYSRGPGRRTPEGLEGTSGCVEWGWRATSGTMK